MSNDDLGLRHVSELPKNFYSTIDETNWGPWKLDRSTRTVFIENGLHTYDVRIADILPTTTLAGTLDHLLQKSWVDNQCLGGLVRAAYAIAYAYDDPLYAKEES